MTTLRVHGFRVVDARNGKVLKKASVLPTIAEDHATKLVKRGIPAIVEKVEPGGEDA